MTCEYTKELKSYINDLKKNLDSFPDSNEEECMNILTNFFSSLNKYLNDPIIQDWKDKALTMVETSSTVECNEFSILFINILTHYVNCLEDFKLFVFDDNLSSYLINYIKTKIIENNIADIIKIGISFIAHYNDIMNIWNKISNKERCQDLSQAILDAINVRTILILYGYYHYIKKIDEFIKTTKNIADIALNELIEHIFSGIDLEECAEMAEMNCILSVPIKNIFKNYLIEQFNKVVLLIDENKNEIIRYVYKFKTDTKKDITDNIDTLISETPPETPSKNTINELFKQILIIVRNYMSYEPIKYKKIDNYITIPQYVGNCWYISMITGMSYSDRSRKLLQKQFSTSIPNLPIEQDTTPMNAANTLFTEFIKYIINTITSKKLRYSNELSDDCGHFINFKNNQTNYLDAIYADLLPKIKKQYPNIPDDINEYISNMDNYIGSAMAYYYKIYLKTEYNNKKFGQPEKSLYGISTHEFIILAYLYNLFNVKTLYLYEMNKKANKKYRKSIFSIYSDENPDIIFIDNIKDKFLDKKYKMLEDYETSFLTYPNLEIIILNDNIYVLDYIIINDNEEGKCETLKCGHVISAITYNKQKYIYNSQFNINNETLEHHIKCGDDEEIRIPCPLFRQNWNIVDTIDFCVRKCYNKQLTDTSSLPDQSYNDIYKLCYSTINSHTIQAYIKLGSLSDIGVSVDNCEAVIKQKIEEYEATTEPEATSGGANKKVKIIINNKIINRVVFKNRYVKINNNNVDLSNFKYSKKYDVYYIKKSDLNIL
jgi:hypothetical protein